MRNHYAGSSCGAVEASSSGNINLFLTLTAMWCWSHTPYIYIQVSHHVSSLDHSTSSLHTAIHIHTHKYTIVGPPCMPPILAFISSHTYTPFYLAATLSKSSHYLPVQLLQLIHTTIYLSIWSIFTKMMMQSLIYGPVGYYSVPSCNGP